MDSGISATRLLEGSKNEEGPLKSLVPGWLIKLGGTALVVGGLGYLWYRNSSLRVYHRIKVEEMCRYQFKLLNKLFYEHYLLGRTIFNSVVLELKIQNPTARLDLNDPNIQKKFEALEDTHFEESIVPAAKNELKRSEYHKLSFFLYKAKLQVLMETMTKKNQQGVALTEEETRLTNLMMIYRWTNSGYLVKAFQVVNLGPLAECFDHKECFQLLVKYEEDSIRAYYKLHQELILEGEPNRDPKKVPKAFRRLFEERVKMESLEAYAIEKLGAAYAEVPEDEKYHPLILFLSKALTPPRGAGYSRDDISLFFERYVFDPHSLLQYYIMKNIRGDPFEFAKDQVIEELSSPLFKEFFKITGIKYDFFTSN